MSTRQVWLAQLRRLDQAHAPNLPIHVDVVTLDLSELRDIVITAVRAYENCLNGNFGRNAQGDYNEIFIRLNPPIFGSSISNVKLVPGRNYLFAQWSSECIQLVDTRMQKAVWTYPESNLPQGLNTLDDALDLLSKDKIDVQSYGVDFRSDGSASVIACFETKRDIALNKRSGGL